MTFGLEGFSAVRPVRVELLTGGYRIAGTITTRFSRVAEILNQLSATHLPVEDATVEAHGAGSPERAPTAVVAVDEILVMLADELADAPSGDMRVPKQPARARLAIPPFWLEGTAYVPVGGRAIDGLLNLADRFIPMTDVRITSPLHPELRMGGPVAAIRRAGAHVIMFPPETDDAPAPDDGSAG
ncbi:MAG TPA: hypothetical protein VLA76_07010 [Candidatus Angelobacter sp.]|nr:hypothetical protein [Candidatus Angelobacter sp.]